MRSWLCSARTKVRSSPAAVTATTVPPASESGIVATAAPLSVRCTAAPDGVSVTKYEGTCPDLTYVLTGGPSGTSGPAAPVTRSGPPWCGGGLTVTTVITIAITASAAASGASRGVQVDHVACGER